MASDSYVKVFEDLLNEAIDTDNEAFLGKLIHATSPSTILQSSNQMNVSGFCNHNYEWVTDQSDHDSCEHCFKDSKEFVLAQAQSQDTKDTIKNTNFIHYCGLDVNNKCKGTTHVETWVRSVKRRKRNEPTTSRGPRKLKIDLDMWKPAVLEIRLEDVFDSDVKVRYLEPKLRYERGDLVWVKMRGYPTWPAMIDDDPDNKTYYWVTNRESEEIQYHVVYFDEPYYASRSWRPESCLKPLSVTPTINFRSMALYKRFQSGFSDAKKASKMSIEQRIAKYGFAAKLSNPDVILVES